MFFRLAADLVIVLHLAFIAGALLGGALAARWRWIPLLQLPAAAWAVLVEFTGRNCPLTDLENLLRNKAGLSGYSESFVERYLLDVIYPSGLSRETQLELAVVVVAVNLAIYGWLLHRRSASRGRPKA